MFRVLILFIFTVQFSFCRRHVLHLKNDPRTSILCSKFGYLSGGFLSVSLECLSSDSEVTFSLDGAGFTAPDSSRIRSNVCFDATQPLTYLKLDQANGRLFITDSKTLRFEAGILDADVSGSNNAATAPKTVKDRLILLLESLYLARDSESAGLADDYIERIFALPSLGSNSKDSEIDLYLTLRQLAENLPPATESRANTVLKRFHDITEKSGSLTSLPFVVQDRCIYANFTVRFPTVADQGWYNLRLHNCPKVPSEATHKPSISVNLKMIEKNPHSFLSGGQEPLPLLYATLCCTYFVMSIFWLSYLRMSKHCVHCIHYLMLTVVFFKSISLAFHGINFFMIGKHGIHEEGWAVMYYITHIFRGALLFITILLIGAGWSFVKHMLSPRERNVFLIVIPLQVLANVATVVIEESEAGAERYAVWMNIFIFLDLACCAAILVPVVWSIRHLQAAAQIDGKAAVNLRNLRLFRHFYILVICYIYFTRIIGYLLTITVPYTLAWSVELFKEAVTIGFFIAVGYKFRPISDNPYLVIGADEENEEDTLMERIQLEDVWSQSGLTDGVTRVTRPQPDSSDASVRLNPAFDDFDQGDLPV